MRLGLVTNYYYVKSWCAAEGDTKGQEYSIREEDIKKI